MLYFLKIKCLNKKLSKIYFTVVDKPQKYLFFLFISNKKQNNKPYGLWQSLKYWCNKIYKIKLKFLKSILKKKCVFSKTKEKKQKLNFSNLMF